MSGNNEILPYLKRLSADIERLQQLQREVEKRAASRVGETVKTRSEFNKRIQLIKNLNSTSMNLSSPHSNNTINATAMNAKITAMNNVLKKRKEEDTKSGFAVSELQEITKKLRSAIDAVISGIKKGSAVSTNVSSKLIIEKDQEYLKALSEHKNAMKEQMTRCQKMIEKEREDKRRFAKLGDEMLEMLSSQTTSLGGNNNNALGMEGLRSGIMNIQTQINQLTQSREDEATRAKSSNLVINSLKIQIENKKREISDLKKIKQNTNNARSNSNEKIMGMTREVQAMKNALENQKKEAEGRKKNLHEIQESLQRAQAQAQAAQKEKNARFAEQEIVLQRRINKLESDKKDVAAAAAEASGQLKNAENKSETNIKKLKEQLAAASASASASAAAAARTRENLESRNAAAAAAAAAATQANQKIKKLKEQLDAASASAEASAAAAAAASAEAEAKAKAMAEVAAAAAVNASAQFIRIKNLEEQLQNTSKNRNEAKRIVEVLKNEKSKAEAAAAAAAAAAAEAKAMAEVAANAIEAAAAAEAKAKSAAAANPQNIKKDIKSLLQQYRDITGKVKSYDEAANIRRSGTSKTNNNSNINNRVVTEAYNEYKKTFNEALREYKNQRPYVNKNELGELFNNSLQKFINSKNNNNKFTAALNEATVDTVQRYARVLLEMLGFPKVIVFANSRRLELDVSDQLDPREPDGWDNGEFRYIGKGTSKDTQYFDSVIKGSALDPSQDTKNKMNEAMKLVLAGDQDTVIFTYGPSGSGKTTVINNLVDRYLVGSGSSFKRELETQWYYNAMNPTNFKWSSSSGSYNTVTNARSDDRGVIVHEKVKRYLKAPTPLNPESSRAQNVRVYKQQRTGGSNQGSMTVKVVDMAGSETPTIIWRQFTGIPNLKYYDALTMNHDHRAPTDSMLVTKGSNAMSFILQAITSRNRQKIGGGKDKISTKKDLCADKQPIFDKINEIAQEWDTTYSAKTSLERTLAKQTKFRDNMFKAWEEVCNKYKLPIFPFIEPLINTVKVFDYYSDVKNPDTKISFINLTNTKCRGKNKSAASASASAATARYCFVPMFADDKKLGNHELMWLIVWFSYVAKLVNESFYIISTVNALKYKFRSANHKNAAPVIVKIGGDERVNVTTHLDKNIMVRIATGFFMDPKFESYVKGMKVKVKVKERNEYNDEGDEDNGKDDGKLIYEITNFTIKEKRKFNLGQNRLTFENHLSGLLQMSSITNTTAIQQISLKLLNPNRPNANPNKGGEYDVLKIDETFNFGQNKTLQRKMLYNGLMDMYDDLLTRKLIIDDQVGTVNNMLNEIMAIGDTGNARKALIGVYDPNPETTKVPLMLDAVTFMKDMVTSISDNGVKTYELQRQTLNSKKTT